MINIPRVAATYLIDVVDAWNVLSHVRLGIIRRLSSLPQKSTIESPVQAYIGELKYWNFQYRQAICMHCV